MVHIPTMRDGRIGFRSPADSAQANEIQQEFFDDIIRLYDVANGLEDDLHETEEALEIITRFQTIHIRELEDRVLQLEDLLRKIKAGSSSKTAFVFAEDMNFDVNTPVQEHIYIDNTYGVATLPITGKTVSKVYIINELTGEIYIPPSLKVQALPASKSGWKIEENDIFLALNGNNQDHWHRKVIMALEDNVEIVTNEFIITLPDDIISSRNVNVINLNPFPVHSMRIDKIEYQLDGDWTLLPGWETDSDNNPVPTEYAGNMKLCFPNTSMKQIKITMTQTNWFEENGMKVFHFGFQEVGVFSTDYQSSIGRMDIPVTLQADTASRLITGIKPVFSNEQILTDKTTEKPTVFTYSIYTVTDSGQLYYTKDTFPILVTDTQLLIKASINADPNNGTTPALKSIELTYEDI